MSGVGVGVGVGCGGRFFDGVGFVGGVLLGTGDWAGAAGGVVFGGVEVLGGAALGAVGVCTGFLSFSWAGWGCFVACDGVVAVEGVGLEGVRGFGVVGAFGAGPAAVGVFDAASGEG